MKILRRAIRDTFTELAKPAIISGVGFAFAFVGYILVLGWDEAMAEFQVWWISVGGSIGAVFLYFIFNLLSAPSRIERDGRIAAESKVMLLEEKLRQRPDFSLTIEQVLWGGEDPQNHPDAYLSVAWVSVRNLGASGSITAKWLLEFEKDGEPVDSELLHMNRAVMAPASGGPNFEISAENAVYNMVEKIVPPGGVLYGHITAVVSKKNASQLGTGVTAIVSCEDVHCKRYTAKYKLGASKPPIFIPGTKIKY